MGPTMPTCDDSGAPMRAMASITISTGATVQAVELSSDSHITGTGTLAAIEGFVELGFTPLQALTAATKSGAIAARLDRELGTLAAGKRADLVMLSADPLTDIRHIRRVDTVIKDGRIVDRAALPSQRILSVAR